jgi:superfamily II DNA or RNA helicase
MTDREGVDRRRYFSARDKQRLLIRAGGRCEGCGQALSEVWHAHHLIPHTSGGDTYLHNGQALCPACHAVAHERGTMTGHTPSAELGKEISLVFGRDYSWQERCLETFVNNLARHYSLQPGQFERAFVMEVTPSGGKTVGSLKIASYLIDQDLVDYVIWLSPRESIKQGIEDDCKMVELTNTAKHKWKQSHFRVDVGMPTSFNRIPKNHHGAIVNYQSLESMLEYFSLLSKHLRLAFVFDEAHHGAYDEETGQCNVWGDAMRRCGSFAHAIICLTGTPVRSDSNRVPYFNYHNVTVDTDDGIVAGYEIVPDFRLSYADGIAAGIARKLIFEHYDPYIPYQVEDATTGDIVGTGQSRLSAMARNLAQQVKHKAFCPEQGIVDDMLRRAHESNSDMRAKGDDDAGILVICANDRDDRRSIDQVKARIRALFKEEPASAQSSDGDEAREAIRRFKTGRDRWIVAKKMISEGTNLPRIRTVVLLTDITRQLNWTQIVHRSTRNEAEDRLQDALILQIDLPHLRKWATEIEEQINIGIEKLPKSGDGDGLGGDGDGPSEKIRALGAYLDEREVMMEGDDYTRYDPPATKLYRALSPETKQEKWHLLKILREGEDMGLISLTDAQAPQASPFTVEEECKAYWTNAQKKIRRAVNAFTNSQGQGKDYAYLMNRCKREAGMGRQKFEELMRTYTDPLAILKKLDATASKVLHEALQKAKKDVA